MVELLHTGVHAPKLSSFCVQSHVVVLNQAIASMAEPPAGTDAHTLYGHPVRKVEIMGTVVSKAVRAECGARATPVFSACLVSRHPPHFQAVSLCRPIGDVVVVATRLWLQKCTA